MHGSVANFLRTSLQTNMYVTIAGYDVLGTLDINASKLQGPCKGEPDDPSIFNKASHGKPRECHTGGDYQEINAQAFSSFYWVSGRVVSDSCGFLLNNCPKGLHDQAVIYTMTRALTGSQLEDPVDNITINDFSDSADAALKLRITNLCPRYPS